MVLELCSRFLTALEGKAALPLGVAETQQEPGRLSLNPSSATFQPCGLGIALAPHEVSVSSQVKRV